MEIVLKHLLYCFIFFFNFTGFFVVVFWVFYLFFLPHLNSRNIAVISAGVLFNNQTQKADSPT